MQARHATQAASAVFTHALARPLTACIARTLPAVRSRVITATHAPAWMSTASTGAPKPRPVPETAPAGSLPPPPTPAAKPRAAVSGGSVSTGRSRLRRWATAVGLAAGVAGLMWQANMSPRDLWDWLTALVSNMTERKLTDPTVEELMVRCKSEGRGGGCRTAFLAPSCGGRRVCRRCWAPPHPVGI